MMLANLEQAKRLCMLMRLLMSRDVNRKQSTPQQMCRVKLSTSVAVC